MIPENKDSRPGEKVITKFFLVMVTVLFAILFYYSLGMTWENEDLAKEFVYFHPDSLLNNIWWLTVVLFLCLVIGKIYDRFSRRLNMTALAILVCLLSLVCSIYWVGASNTAPQSDQERLCDLASAFDKGDCSGLAKGGYAGRNIHQLGLVTLIRILFRVFGDGNYRAFQYFSALMIPLIIFSGYQIVKRIGQKNEHAELFYLLFMLLCVPLYCYVPFVYGDICSVAFILFAAWMLLDCLNRFSWVQSLALGGAVGLAVLVRQNILILLIAFLIVIVVKLSDKLCWKTIIVGINILAGVIVGQLLIHIIYAPYTPQDSKPTPSILYVVMGMNDGESGWYNRYHDDVYEACNFDPEQAKRQGREDLQEFLEKCREDPKYMIDFYYRKMNTQWNAPMYQCLAMNNRIVGLQSRLAVDVYFGEMRYKLQDCMNIYQLLVYGSVLFLLLVGKRHWVSIENCVLLIGIFGGFLFSLIWEAKTRYVFPYFLMMIPYAAIGVSEMVSRLDAGVLSRISAHYIHKLHNEQRTARK